MTGPEAYLLVDSYIPHNATSANLKSVSLKLGLNQSDQCWVALHHTTNCWHHLAMKTQQTKKLLIFGPEIKLQHITRNYTMKLQYEHVGKCNQNWKGVPSIPAKLIWRRGQGWPSPLVGGGKANNASLSFLLHSLVDQYESSQQPVQSLSCLIDPQVNFYQIDESQNNRSEGNLLMDL
jgi:hypothetical protein